MARAAQGLVVWSLAASACGPTRRQPLDAYRDDSAAQIWVEVLAPLGGRLGYGACDGIHRRRPLAELPKEAMHAEVASPEKGTSAKSQTKTEGHTTTRSKT